MLCDLESTATRGISLAEGRKIAGEEYVAYYAALGLDPDKTTVYFQSQRNVVQKLGFQLGKRTNLSNLKRYTDLMVQPTLLTFNSHWYKQNILRPQLMNTEDCVQL